MSRSTARERSTVPNTAYVDIGYHTAFERFGTGDYILTKALETAGIWSRWGLHVRMTCWLAGIPLTASVVHAHLGSDDIFAYGYFGHGGASGDLIPDGGETDGEHVYPSARPGVYLTKYGVYQMILLACYTDWLRSRWQYEVSRYGTLMTVHGEIQVRFNPFAPAWYSVLSTGVR
jgi:hypothetical protein